MVIHYKHI